MTSATSFVAERPVDLDQRSLRRLSKTLRLPETWPPGFVTPGMVADRIDAYLGRVK